MNINENILAYTAGVFDADGCVAIDKRPPKGPQKTPKYTAVFSIQMAERPTIDFIAKHFGLKVYFRDLKNVNYKDNKARKSAYRVQCGAQKAADFLRAILPYVQGKKEQVQLCLDFCELVKGRGGKRLSDEELGVREFYYKKLRQLKTRDFSTFNDYPEREYSQAAGNGTHPTG